MTQISNRVIAAPSDWATLFRIRARELGLTHREVDGLANLTDGYFSKICAGKKVPGGEIIVRICAALQVELRPMEKMPS
ncbi:helix-turn-helix transcriptional regulator [Bradyrhizobium sp. UNPA324]|uniref:helix-turn-helix domain-containing protein n=1 Tax=Bradyrhizobium sp. UNPA324 TaxID=1141174 RepID=UPI001152A32B|nr:helix-turn-helix transcriptional regulator [Bradyrhizobium sp. UNPA324]